MSDRALIVAAFIIGGAIVASSFSTRTRYSLSAAGNNVVWRMDTWSGNIDICAAAYLPTGPVVSCGAIVVTPGPQLPGVPPDSGPTPPGSVPLDPPRERASYQRDSRVRSPIGT
jgi:hypothetical protein